MPLHLAAYGGNAEVVRLLLDYGANAAAEDKRGKTPFQVALEIGMDEITKLLTDLGSAQLRGGL